VVIQQLLRPDIAIVTKLAVASLGKFRANVRNAGQANVRLTLRAKKNK